MKSKIPLSTQSQLPELPVIFQPNIVSISVDANFDALITDVETELKKFAQKDINHCWGYFPALTEKNNGLRAAAALHTEQPTIILNDKELELNFIRLSLVQQKGASPYHMDSDSKTALTGDVDTINSRLVWRLLLNFSLEHSRTLGYLNLDTSKIELTTEGGYIHYTGDTSLYEKASVLKPRTQTKIHGVLFCASRVLHTGKDDKNGHFVAGYGCEELA